jgi:hypothetical protein
MVEGSLEANNISVYRCWVPVSMADTEAAPDYVHPRFNEECV